MRPPVLDHSSASSSPSTSTPSASSAVSSVSSPRALRLLRGMDSLVNLVVLIVIVVMVMVSGYALWDTNQVFSQASASQYEQYKPTRVPDGKQAFARLQEVNPDVIGWLSVHGTPIDYPLVQGQDDMHYVNTNPLGKPAMSGSIFLAAANSPHFTDFNHIVYGHHMDKDAMFGPLDKYADAVFFDSHPSGTLYYDGTDHGIEFFAFTHTDAYNTQVFTPAIQDPAFQHDYLDGLLNNAMHTRTLDTSVTTSDRLVLLTTCSGTTTNGRDILIGRILDHPIPDPFADNEHNRGTGADTQTPWWTTTPTLITIISALLTTGLLLFLTARRKNTHTNTGASVTDTDTDTGSHPITSTRTSDARSDGAITGEGVGP